MKLLNRFFNFGFDKAVKTNEKEDVVCLREGVGGNWHYHIAIGTKPLCGNEDTMECGSPLNSWGFKPDHIPHSYCRTCERVAKEKGIL